ncbi:hypothetical protein ARMSODRAFT_317953 [Armillaria solidipes]|uniref:Uncharacterized protein n=1 Tax=Armillaria solidipes TaxID=1076256 RepID=A0A2H3BSN1_9AGAR|nr:hypothetical protein ARMSODRAFT_317953 [Armillaria solidipes]
MFTKLHFARLPCHLSSTLCRELHPHYLLVGQQQDIRSPKTTAMKVPCRQFISRHLRNLTRQASKNPPWRAQSLKLTLKLNSSSRMSSWSQSLKGRNSAQDERLRVELRLWTKFGPLVGRHILGCVDASKCSHECVVLLLL